MSQRVHVYISISPGINLTDNTIKITSHDTVFTEQTAEGQSTYETLTDSTVKMRTTLCAVFTHKEQQFKRKVRSKDS